ncbi:MAG TPA: transporter substrate-binding domain-containing protein [Rhodocyclaceae bacterium]|nr:transporter substrate-binding domain-containing protein [Rhodocyclaceae bacterium]
MKAVLRSGLGFSLLLAFIDVTMATPRPACPAEPIRVGYFEFGVVFSIERDVARRQGFGIDRDIAFELQKRSGCRFEGHVMSRARIWVEMADGRLDMTLSAIKTPEREAMAWMIPYSTSHQSILLSTRLAIRQRSEAGFMAERRLKFAVVRGFRHSVFHDALLDRLRAEGRVVEVVDERQLFESLKNGSADAIVSSPMLYAHYLQAEEIGRQIVVAQWNSGEDMVVSHLMLSRRSFSAAEAEKWRTLLAELQADGTMRAILGRYVDPKTAHGMRLPKSLELKRLPP